LIYNAVFGLHLWNVSNDSNLVYLTTPLWLLSYAFLTTKTRAQLSGSPLSYHTSESSIIDITLRKEGFRGLYQGLVPFVLLNVYFMYSFPSLFSEDKKRKKLEEIASKDPQGSFRKGENLWS